MSQSKEQLRFLNEELEQRVRDRTRELAEANVSLQSEIADRRAAEERIKNLLRQLVNSEEQQRRRIARELHDTLGQQLAALHMNLELLKAKANSDQTVLADIERMSAILDQLNSNIDFLAWELRPASLDLLGLDAAFKTYVRDWSEQFGIEAAYHSTAMGGARLSPDVETHLYRIFQEVLQNVHKHSNADHVSVLFERREDQAVLIVEDNGSGYDADQPISDDRGMGLTNIKERAALVNGHIEIESQPGVGTTVFARVPVSEAA